MRIRVRTFGINFADTLMIAGKYQVKPQLPVLARSSRPEIANSSPDATRVATFAAISSSSDGIHSVVLGVERAPSAKAAATPA